MVSFVQSLLINLMNWIVFPHSSLILLSKLSFLDLLHSDVKSQAIFYYQFWKSNGLFCRFLFAKSAWRRFGKFYFLIRSIWKVCSYQLKRRDTDPWIIEMIAETFEQRTLNSHLNFLQHSCSCQFRLNAMQSTWRSKEWTPWSVDL